MASVHPAATDAMGRASFGAGERASRPHAKDKNPAKAQPFSRAFLSSPSWLTRGCHTVRLLLLFFLGGLFQLHGTEIRFREPQAVHYLFENSTATSTSRLPWLRAWPRGDCSRPVELGSRVVLQTDGQVLLRDLLQGRPLRIDRSLGHHTFILACPDAITAFREARRLAAQWGVLYCRPVMRRTAAWAGPVAPMPSDKWFPAQWYLENRTTNGAPAGPDLNLRSAWPTARGQGVTLAVADGGVEITHPDLLGNTEGTPHFNFANDLPDGSPLAQTPAWAHGTAIAGLIAAIANNGIGMAGVAPEARLASWVIRDTNNLLVDDERLMDMFQYQTAGVAIQNHSWTHAGIEQHPLALTEFIGISNAVRYGRSGHGVIMVRSAGNGRQAGENANDDGYLAMPEVIGVAAVRADGRVASYSEPGACLLVAAPSGDADAPTLFTTDLTGVHGANMFQFFPPNEDLNNYVFNNLGFSGTSGAAPLVSGVVALMLSANPSLAWRDVQQILILAARHFHHADPDLTTNGAGLAVSHNAGFGVPDAGQAVRLALHWSNLPPRANVLVSLSTAAEIPDGALCVRVYGPDPVGDISLVCLPGTGLFPDLSTQTLPLEDVGTAQSPIWRDLAGKAALIERTGDDYATPLANAAAAGAALAIVYNSTNGTTHCHGGDSLCPLLGTDFVPIPAAFIRRSDGQNLKERLGWGVETRVQYGFSPTNLDFQVSAAMICEHVGVRIQTDHPLRGDLRLTLLSPGGTRSVLQRLNQDTNAGPVDWTYYSTHHFLEATAGRWTLSVGDQFPGAAGRVTGASLILWGRPITDADADGLEDSWELLHFGTLASGPRADPDHDGHPNAVEQLLHTDPTARAQEITLDLSSWNQRLVRLSWPAGPMDSFEVWSSSRLDLPFVLLTNIPGRFPETECFVDRTIEAQKFFRVRAHTPPAMPVP